MQLCDSYCLGLVSTLAQGVTDDLAETVYDFVCRTDFTAPGFALIDLGPACDSRTFRTWMLVLKDELSRIHRERADDDVTAVWLGRFDQQVTTKFHLDGGPTASLLMLGYEPTNVQSRVVLADYSHCAATLGLTPQEFLSQHNPMFSSGERLLDGFITDVSCESDHYHILLINNSSQSQTDERPGWQGVMHQATILTPLPEERRIINSMLLSVGSLTPDALTPSVRHNFLTTELLNQRM